MEEGLLVPGIPLAMASSMQISPDLSPPSPPSKSFIYVCYNSFWSYEYCKRCMASENDDAHQVAMKVLLCGGIAGIATWASVFPLDVIKTRLQAQTAGTYPEGRPLLSSQGNRQALSTFHMARETYRAEGMKAFYRGLGVCSVRAFIVNAIQVRSFNVLERRPIAYCIP